MKTHTFTLAAFFFLPGCMAGPTCEVDQAAVCEAWYDERDRLGCAMRLCPWATDPSVPAYCADALAAGSLTCEDTYRIALSCASECR